MTNLGAGERDRALTRALEKLGAVEDEHQGMPNALHDALRSGDNEGYRVLMRRRGELPGELAMARIAVKQVQVENLRAAVPDLEATIERCNRAVEETTARREALRVEWQRANDADVQARATVQTHVQDHADMHGRIRTLKAEIQRLMDAATVTAVEAA